MNNPSNNQFDTYIPKKISRYSNLNVSEMRVLAIITGLHKKINVMLEIKVLLKKQAFLLVK